MAQQKISIPKFMKYAGSIEGPADLSSRRGFSRVVVEDNAEEAADVDKSGPRPVKRSVPGKTRRAASLR
jgi:hypothetical protein